ncbi:MAG: right-handed parallel beta-helix repeat-containing protein [Deltaproteobacteria bacterium]|nr:right-handed parallel beta-helix repeat-containing protein [Deltaproteobacteria bacterium]
MHARTLVALLTASLFALPASAMEMPDATGAIHVCKEGGDNKAAGTKEAPLKNIDKVLKSAKGGETILVCGGSYSGTFDIGFFESKKAVKMYGSYSKDFSKRDIIAHPTLLQPDNKSGAKSRKALLKFTSEVDGLVIDGFVFDLGQRNAYSSKDGQPAGVETGMLLLPPKKEPGQNATVTEPCLSIPSAAKEGSVTITNNVFANCASYGIQGGLRGGTWKVSNNVFVANRMAAVEIYGTCRVTKPGPTARQTNLCGHVEFDHNTVLFTWSRLEDFLDMGYGFRVMTMVSYDVHDNIFGTNIQAGIDHSRFNQLDIKIDNNGFFVNKNADLEYSPESNTKLTLRAEEFADLELTSVSGNTTKMPKGFTIDKAYLEGFLAARYSEKTDYDENSPANVLRSVMGMNKVGKIETKVSMFGNRYPVDAAVKLFGGIEGKGAQKP